MAPIATREITRPSAPWITADIKAAMTTRNLLRKSNKSNRFNMSLRNNYKEAKKLLKLLIDKGKKQYDRFPEKKNIATWKTTREIVDDELL